MGIQMGGQMRKALMSLAAGAALVATAGVANADGYGYGSAKDAPLAAPQVNWNGLYIGAAIGYGFAHNEVTYEYESPDIYDGLNGDGFQGILTLGYDRQIHNGLVFGIFADYAFGKLEWENSWSDVRATLSVDDSWAVGARLGLIRSCCTMWYATAGYAQAKFELKDTSGGSWFDEDATTTLKGWFVGGGVEQQLRDNLFLKAEYRYTDYGSEKLYASEYETLDVDTNVHSVRLGVNWKVDLFGGHRGGHDSLK